MSIVKRSLGILGLMASLGIFTGCTYDEASQTDSQQNDSTSIPRLEASNLANLQNEVQNYVRQIWEHNRTKFPGINNGDPIVWDDGTIRNFSGPPDILISEVEASEDMSGGAIFYCSNIPTPGCNILEEVTIYIPREIELNEKIVSRTLEAIIYKETVANAIVLEYYNNCGLYAQGQEEIRTIMDGLAFLAMPENLQRVFNPPYVYATGRYITWDGQSPITTDMIDAIRFLSNGVIAVQGSDGRIRYEQLIPQSAIESLYRTGTLNYDLTHRLQSAYQGEYYESIILNYGISNDTRQSYVNQDRCE